MFSRFNAVRSLRRLAQAQFLSAVAAISFITMPAWAADDAPTSIDTPVQQPEQPAAESAPAPDVCAAPQITQVQFEELMTRAVAAARSLANLTVNAIETRTAAGSETPNPLSSDSAKPEAAPLSDVQAKQAAIDAINAQIEEEQARSARRISELKEQLCSAQQDLTSLTSVDNEGFIRAYLVCGPIPVDQKVENHDEDSTKDLLDRNYVPAGSTPKDGDVAAIDGLTRNWKAIQTTDYFVDLASVAEQQELDAEHAAYIGVAYITSETEISDVRLSIGSDDDSAWRVNGKEVIRSYGGRGVEKDQNAADGITLKQGVNVLSFTVLNGNGPTAAAARFLDQNGNPIAGLKVSLTPPTAAVAQTDNSQQPGTETPAK